MIKMSKSVFPLILLLGILGSCGVAGAEDKLAEAIAATPVGTGTGQIDSAALPGFLGIPGAPDVNLVLAFLWSIWVGWIFSTSALRQNRKHANEI